MLRKCFLILMLAMIATGEAHAQIIHGRRVDTSTDSLIRAMTDTMTFQERDTIPEYEPEDMPELMELPAFSRPESQLIHIMPHQHYWFNVVMDVELNFGGSSRYVGLFINTTNGYIGFTRPNPSDAENVLFPELEDFTFTVISYKLGKIFIYHNQKASGHSPMQHLVSTGNTENHDYFEGNLMTSAPIRNKRSTRSYCSGQYTATLYKQDGLPTVWYLYGNEFGNHRPMPGEMQIQKYIGGWGVGFVQTSKGKFIIMEKSGNGRSYARIKSIQMTHAAFDPTDYKLMEQEFYRKNEERFRQEDEDIVNDAAKIANTDHCQAEQTAVINFRKENLDRQRQNQRRSQQGNLLQDSASQRAFVSIMMNPAITLKGEILNLQLNICNATYRMNKPTTSAGQRERLADKIGCYNHQLSRLQQALAQMEQIDHQYHNIVEANGRKARLLMQLQAAGGCD